MALAAAVRRGLLGATESMAPDERALERGLTIGDTTGFGPSTIESFRRSGLSHLLAVSGSNVAIVIGTTAFALRRFAHRTRIILSAAALTLFVLVVGPQPSVLRAAAMGAVGLAALGWGYRTEPMRALGLALLIVITARPGLVHSAGLQLSAAATAGIVLWTGAIAARLDSLPAPIALALGATLAAQIAVAPVLVATFGELSLIAPLANLIAFPAVAPATVLGLTAGGVGMLSPALGAVIAGWSGPFARWILIVAERSADVGWASVSLPRWVGLLLAAPVVGAAVRSVWRTPRDRCPPSFRVD